MAKIIKNDFANCYTIAGISSEQFFTLVGIVRKEALKAADPSNEKYDEQEAQKVLSLDNAIQEELRNIIRL